MHNLHASNGGLRGYAGWNGLCGHDWSIWGDADWSYSFDYVMGGADCAIVLSSENAITILIKPLINLNVHYRNISCGVIIVLGTIGMRVIYIFIDLLKPFTIVIRNERINFMYLSGLYLSGTPPPRYELILKKITMKRPAWNNPCLRSFSHLVSIKEKS